MKNARKSINSRKEQAKDRISDLEDRNFEITQSEKKKGKKNEKVKKKPTCLSDTIQRINIRITGVPEKEEEKGAIKLIKRKNA